MRFRLPDWAQAPRGPLELYQWLGLALAGMLSWLIAHLCLLASPSARGAGSCARAARVLTRRSSSEKLRPFDVAGGGGCCSQVLTLLDLPVRVVDTFLPLKNSSLAA